MKTALITGSTKGIGLEVAKELAALGFHIYLSGRNEKAGKKETEKLVKSGASVEFVPLDIADLNSIRNAFNFISKDCKKLDVLINNAAVQPDSGLSIENIPAEIIHEIVNVNILGAIFVTQVFTPLLKKGSRVINVSSTGGQLSSGMGDWAPLYCISKTALNGITVQFAKAFKSKGIALYSVCPGWVRTDMGGSMAPRSVEEGAATPVWLATEAPLDQTGLSWQDKKVAPW
jgi:NAD(P)-dependent dehydrogenase (short-subunit alcohol dehydrogenase family)